eukprot:322776-Alexandrium_andersonii.AAC.1
MPNVVMAMCDFRVLSVMSAWSSIEPPGISMSSLPFNCAWTSALAGRCALPSVALTAEPSKLE